jgi:hypothetical protein
MTTERVIQGIVEPVKAQKARLEKHLTELMVEVDSLKDEIRSCERILVAAEEPKKKSPRSRAKNNGLPPPLPETFQRYESAIATLYKRVGQPVALNDMVDLGLNRSTVTRVVNELRERGVMRMVGKDGAAFLYVYEGDA